MSSSTQPLTASRRWTYCVTAPRPASRGDLILLNLNMPGMGGLDLLAMLKADPDLRRIPVLMLTTSAASSDIHAAYDAYVTSYVVKPLDVEQVASVMQAILDYWFGIVSLPHG